MATYTLSTISHILWYLHTWFTVHTSRLPWYSSQHPPYSDVWQTNWLRQLSCFLVSSPLDISNFSFTLPLVLVDLQVHLYSVRSARYLWILSSAWSVCLRSLSASRDFCLISTSFAPNTWLKASTSLCLLPCQFLLHLFLATFLCCCFCASFGVPRCQIPVLACWCIVAPGSRIGLFLISYSLGRFCMLTLDQYQPPSCSALFWGPSNLNPGQSTEMCPCWTCQ